MKVVYRGLTIELAEGDPRIGRIEAILFGRPVTDPPPPPREETVPVAFRGWWLALSAREREELVLLAAGDRRPAELEKALGVAQAKLGGQHGAMSRLAGLRGLEFPIRARGYGRKNRRFYLAEPDATWVRILADRDAGAPEGT